MPERGSDIFAYTPTYGSRRFLATTVHKMRAKAGTWFDWGVWLGSPSPEALADARELLEAETGIQLLRTWPENRGQHHATQEALAHARERGYRFLLRLDDDVVPRTKKWLTKLVDCCEDLRERARDPLLRMVAAPKVLRLRNPLQPQGSIQLGQPFPADVMGLLGGGCRLHPVALLDGYEPPLLDPKGRGDPQSIAQHVDGVGGFQVRFPHIRVVHDTDQIEAEDDEERTLIRRMGYYWPYLGEE